MKIIWDCQLIQATFNYFLSNCYILMTKYSGGPNSIAKSENHLDSNVHHFLRNWDIGTIFAALNRITPLVLGHVISYVSKNFFFWVMSMPQLTVISSRVFLVVFLRLVSSPLSPCSIPIHFRRLTKAKSLLVLVSKIKHFNEFNFDTTLIWKAK